MRKVRIIQNNVLFVNQGLNDYQRTFLRAIRDAHIEDVRSSWGLPKIWFIKFTYEDFINFNYIS